MTRVAFVFFGSRDELIERHAAGLAPDHQLHGQNHLADHSIESWNHDPLLTRRKWRPAPVQKFAWFARELSLPFELGDADTVITTLSTLYPIVERRRRVFVMAMSLCNKLSRPAPGRGLNRASLRRADGIVCFGHWQRERLIELAGLEPERAHVLPVSVDSDFFTPRAEEPGDYVLAVGYDIGRDYATMAEAVRGLPYRAVFVCRERNVAGLDLPPNVEIDLETPFTRLRDLYAGARAVVVPSRGDGYAFGSDMPGATSIVETLAMGKPLITTERAWLDDYVVRGESALTVPAEDPAALRAAILEVASDEALAASLGRAGRSTVEEKLSSRRFAEGLVDLIGAQPNAVRSGAELTAAAS